ncbi:YhgE/Pip domain-containing protein [Saccharopolyspora sp. HNM0986]|uniref:YhgE/Pip domain-containing protein n=1 Tax=Saccharopolyspora galaxeae TaxID=2781241 RepID=UPI00190DA170|nr:YhgE/Pip domain-containing protein [Saccharopolyspora sp. HNM0986]MBK0866947.1 YhgE/Pip domain-containing protein [Saccharopolyspora sp. HNM0986]
MSPSLKERSRFRVRWLPLLGLLLVPLAIAGLLTWSLGKPQDRLKDVKAAVVNTDEPVEINGQLTPLGRQLSAKLVGGEIKSNYTWEFATPETAREGLEDGTYSAVVTIPKNFSQAATSFSGDPAQAKRATVDVDTGDRSRLADEAISKTVTDTAANLLGQQLTTTYLDNIYVGFNTLNDQLGEASKGATQLADGADQLAGGTDQLSGGAGQLADGTRQLAGGLGALDNGAGQLAQGMNALTGGLQQIQQQTAQLPDQVGTLADVSAKESQGVQQLNTGLQGMAKELGEMSKECPPGVVPMCNKLAVQAATAKALSEGGGQLQQASTGVSGGLEQLSGGLPALTGGLGQLAGGAEQLNGGMGQLAGGLSQTSGGAGQLADGADQLAGGTRGLADGARQLGDGTGQLSDGLGEAVEKLPKYPDGDRDKLAKAVANPVTTAEGTSIGFGSSGLALYAVLALWAGAVITFLVLRPKPERTLESTRSSFRLALDQARSPAALAVVQGLLVSVVVGIAGDLSVGQWFGCAGLLALTAVAFTAVNQGLAAAFGNIGRFVGLLVGLVVLANGFISAVPGVLGQISAALPVGPAQDALRALTGGGTVGGGSIAVLVVWGLAGLVVTYLAVERGRTVRATQFRPAYTFRRGMA